MGRLNSVFGIRQADPAVNPAPLPPQEFSQLIEQLSVSIADPLLKLKFINTALDRYDQTCRLMGVATLHVALCQQILLEVAHRLLPGHSIYLPRSTRAIAAPRLTPKRRVLRRAFVALGIALLVVTYLTHRRHARYGVQAQAASSSTRTPTAILDRFSDKIAASLRVATGAATASAAPEVWLVEKKAGYEFYSNGLRISTEHETTGESRFYRTFARAGGALSELKQTPAGLLYHTSEGDVPPFQSAFNRTLTRQTHGLLSFIKQNRLYNYLIDRFGRVYRVVPDHAVAYHAGHSVWSDETEIYLLLNQSFLGICFEGRWSDPEGAATEPASAAADTRVITPAQVMAGRQLTDMLRHQYQISDLNCVTHGLVSVNPQRHLIGHHLDWATGFPFRELGLTDKYQLPLPSIVAYGFSYDNFFLQIIGKPWPGIDRAMAQLQAQAARENIPYETLRYKLNQQFERQLARIRSRSLAATDNLRTAPEDAGPPAEVADPARGQP